MPNFTQSANDLLNIREDIRDCVPTPKHREWNINPHPSLRLLIIEVDSTVTDANRTVGILDRKTDVALIKNAAKYDELADYLERHDFTVDRRSESSI